MDRRYKNILKIFGIWFGICLISAFLYRCFVSDYDMVTPADFFGFLIICSLGVFIVFSPSILILYFLFKKFKNPIFRILLTAFVIPFTNFIYNFIEYFWFRGSFNAEIIGFCTLFVTLPFWFITVLCTPKSILPLKWDVIKTIILTAIFGIGLIMLSLEIDQKISDITAKNRLDKYDVIIDDIENYKKQNGVYPQKIDDNVRQFEQFYYNPVNSGMDYILTVGDSYIILYNYCSSEKPDGCHPQATERVLYEKYGKWIKAVEYD